MQVIARFGECWRKSNKKRRATASKLEISLNAERGHLAEHPRKLFGTQWGNSRRLQPPRYELILFYYPAPWRLRRPRAADRAGPILPRYRDRSYGRFLRDTFVDAHRNLLFSLTFRRCASTSMSIVRGSVSGK
ncbi:hypothetical protein EVAR_23820_1 [Eumeta japonica]|uniref:Uncharacterized protein n=1 Tax=Eumeta variegata TaxID=151549 RepID=A0A4C1VMT8_EUMVA|nr:hypothetical protein EVAR_23820_1 [Eumeta japonica]